MSSNNQLIIIKEKGEFLVYENLCVDNDFKPNKNDTLLKKFKIMESAFKFCHKYMQENLVEYGIYAHPSCWGK